MKIFAYEVRKDEIEDFKRLEEKYNVEITLSNEVPSLDNVNMLEGYTAVTILGQGRIDQELLEAMKNIGIQYLTTRTIGTNHIDLEYAKQIGIQVNNASYAPNGVADYTIMLMLLVLRNYKPALWRGQVYDYSLQGLQGKELRSLTIGIIGTGRIGLKVIENLSGFGCKIYAYDPYENPAVSKYATYVSLETIYKECDIISLHTPLTKENYHMINKDTIHKMKDGVILINCARGELMAIDDLIDGIESCKIGGLGLDTVESEEGIIHLDRRLDILTNRQIAYLRQFPNVVMTQHMAFYTKEAVASMVECGIKGILDMN